MSDPTLLKWVALCHESICLFISKSAFLGSDLGQIENQKRPVSSGAWPKSLRNCHSSAIFAEMEESLWTRNGPCGISTIQNVGNLVCDQPLCDKVWRRFLKLSMLGGPRFFSYCIRDLRWGYISYKEAVARTGAQWGVWRGSFPSPLAESWVVLRWLEPSVFNSFVMSCIFCGVKASPEERAFDCNTWRSVHWLPWSQYMATILGWNLLGTGYDISALLHMNPSLDLASALELNPDSKADLNSTSSMHVYLKQSVLLLVLTLFCL